MFQPVGDAWDDQPGVDACAVRGQCGAQQNCGGSLCNKLAGFAIWEAGGDYHDILLTLYIKCLEEIV